MDYTVHGILQARILEWVAHPFSSRSSQPRVEPRSPHCTWILYCLSHHGSSRILESASHSDVSNSATLWTVACQAPLSMGILQARILEWVALPSSRRIFPTQGLNRGFLHCRLILYRLSYQGSPRMLEWVAQSFSRRSF